MHEAVPLWQLTAPLSDHLYPMLMGWLGFLRASLDLNKFLLLYGAFTW